MTDTLRSKRQSHDETLITSLAQQARADVDVVRRLYNEEIEALQKEAVVKGFIGLIAARRVKERLQAARKLAHRSHPR